MTIIKENDDISTKVEFVEHPQELIFMGKSPSLVQCVIKNSIRSHIECNNEIRDDAKRKVYVKDSVKHELLTLFLRKKDYDRSQSIVCKCVGYSRDNERLLSNRAIIKNPYLDIDFISEPMDEVTYEGDTIEMRCDPPKGEPTPQVYWLKDKRQINTNSDSSRFKLSNDFSLLILESRLQDSGNYVCVASNLADRRDSKPAKLTIIEKNKMYTWSEWSDWSKCSSECGPGIQRRTRTCQTIKKHAQIQTVSKSMCDNGPSFEDQPCQLKSCPKSPESQWTDWSEWSECSSDCKQFKKRACIKVEDTVNDMDKASTIGKENYECQGDSMIIRECIDESKVGLNKCQNNLSNQFGVANNIFEIGNQNVSTVMHSNAENNYFAPKLIKSALNKAQLTENYSKTDFKMNEMYIKFGISLITAMLFVSLAILVYIILTVIRKKRHSNPKKHLKNKSQSSFDQNFYYTCEKQQTPATSATTIEDEFSIFKSFKTSSTSSGTTSRSTTEHQKPLFEQQQQQQPQAIYAEMIEPSINNTNNQIYEMVQNLNGQTYLMKSPHQLNLCNHLNTSTISSCLSSTLQPSASTKLINLSSSSSRSNFNYLASPFYYKQQHVPISYGDYRESGSDEAFFEFDEDIQRRTCSRLNELNYFFCDNDLCIGKVDYLGARLTLDCGLSLLIPEGAITSNESQLIYLGLCRNESFKPKIHERSTFLSEIISIGFVSTTNLTLAKPAVLIFEHSAKNLVEEWCLNLFYDNFISNENPPNWNEEQLSTSKTMNLNVIKNHFVLITEKFGRFIISGGGQTVNSASKYYRLIVFCSSSLTNNDLSLRIYCVDNLLTALEEVLRDEKKIGGILLEASEPFLISYSNQSLKIFIDYLNDNCFKCKFNVNCQEIPLNHIWNGRNHLLYCCFNLEKVFSKELIVLNCKISVCESNSNSSYLVQMDVFKNLLKIFNQISSFNKKENNLLVSGLKNWNISHYLYLKSWNQLIYPFNLIKNYFKINKSNRMQLIEILDYSDSKKWTILARNLGIKGSLCYFENKPSPTEMLLIFFEAISELRLNHAHEALKDDQNIQDDLFRELFSFLDSNKK